MNGTDVARPLGGGHVPLTGSGVRLVQEPRPKELARAKYRQEMAARTRPLALGWGAHAIGGDLANLREG